MKVKELNALRVCGVIAIPSKIVKRNGKDVTLYNIYSRR